jgi:hypothetical protein
MISTLSTTCELEPSAGSAGQHKSALLSISAVLTRHADTRQAAISCTKIVLVLAKSAHHFAGLVLPKRAMRTGFDGGAGARH